MAPDERLSICQAHIPLLTQVTELSVIQKQVVENQREMFLKLDEIREAAYQSKFIAIKDLATITSDIAGLQLKLKPHQWAIGAGIIGAVSEMVYQIHKFFSLK